MSNCYDSNFLIWQNVKFIIVIVAFFRKEWEKAEVERKMDQVNVAIADGRILSLLQRLDRRRLQKMHSAKVRPTTL